MGIEPTVQLWNYTIRITYKSYYLYKTIHIFYMQLECVQKLVEFFFQHISQNDASGSDCELKYRILFPNGLHYARGLFSLFITFYVFLLYAIYRTQRNGNLVLRLLLTIFQGIIEQLRVEWRSLTPILLFILLYIYDITITPILMRAILMF